MSCQASFTQRKNRRNDGGNKNFCPNAAGRLMLLFMGFVTAVGFHRLGLLREFHSALDSIDSNVKDAKAKNVPECKKKKNLNVVLFYADDWTMKVLGKLDKRVKTPNNDAMADNGMLFTNNFCDGPDLHHRQRQYAR
jgi:hypothetical protein